MNICFSFSFAPFVQSVDERRQSECDTETSFHSYHSFLHFVIFINSQSFPLLCLWANISFSLIYSYSFLKCSTIWVMILDFDCRLQWPALLCYTYTFCIDSMFLTDAEHIFSELIYICDILFSVIRRIQPINHFFFQKKKKKREEKIRSKPHHCAHLFW